MLKLWIILITFTTTDGQLEQRLGLPPVDSNTEQSCMAAADAMQKKYEKAPGIMKFKAECGHIDVSPYLGQPV